MATGRGKEERSARDVKSFESVQVVREQTAKAIRFSIGSAESQNWPARLVVWSSCRGRCRDGEVTKLKLPGR